MLRPYFRLMLRIYQYSFSFKKFPNFIVLCFISWNFSQEAKKPVFGTPKFFNQDLNTDQEDFGKFEIDLKTVPVQVTPPNGMKKRFVNIEYNDPLAELFKVKIHLKKKTKVVYICSSLLQLIVESCDLSHARN